MAFTDQALLSNDPDFQQRLAACAAVEVDLGGQFPPAWATVNQWEVAASPGFADDYASAIAAGIPRPGADQSVISDEELRAAVQSLFGAT
jgi:hypothetical protein